MQKGRAKERHQAKGQPSRDSAGALGSMSHILFHFKFHVMFHKSLLHKRIQAGLSGVQGNGAGNEFIASHWGSNSSCSQAGMWKVLGQTWIKYRRSIKPVTEIVRYCGVRFLIEKKFENDKPSLS